MNKTQNIKVVHTKLSNSLKKCKKGFTLIEVMIAMIIMAGALLLLTNSWGSAFARLRKTQMSFEMSALIERKMTEIDLEYRNKFAEIPEEKEDKFGDKYPQYSWKLNSKKLEIPDLSGMMIGQEGGADQFTITLIQQLTDGLSKAVKEVTVTVIYNPPGGGKPLSHSVTTYFVDFNKELKLGIPGG